MYESAFLMVSFGKIPAGRNSVLNEWVNPHPMDIFWALTVSLSKVQDLGNHVLKEVS